MPALDWKLLFLNCNSRIMRIIPDICCTPSHLVSHLILMTLWVGGPGVLSSIYRSGIEVEWLTPGQTATKRQNWGLLKSKAHYVYPSTENLPRPGAQHWSHNSPGRSKGFRIMGQIARTGIKWQVLGVGQGRELGSRELGGYQGPWKEGRRGHVVSRKYMTPVSEQTNLSTTHLPNHKPTIRLLIHPSTHPTIQPPTQPVNYLST